MKKLTIIFILFFVLIFIFFNKNFSAKLNDLFSNSAVSTSEPINLSDQAKIEFVSQKTWKDPRNLFPIFAYSIPHNSKNITESLRIIERGGINIIINGSLGWIEDAQKVREGFEKLENSNLKWLVIVGNECKDDFIFNNTNDKTNNDIKKYLRMFNGNYVYGWYVWDEPGSNKKSCSPLNIIPNDDNADINRMTKQIRSDSVFNNKLEFVNLFPSYWDLTPNVEAYENYLDAFISSQEYKPRILCFDHYPLLKSDAGGFRNDFYSNLSIIRKKSIEYDIPFWMIVLSSGHGHYINPSFEEISLQVYSALAYGARGIGYYLFSKSWENFGYKSWILENFVDNSNFPDSLYGPLFLPVKNLNAEVQIIGKILLGLESVEVVHSSDYPNKQKNISETVLKIGKPNRFIKNVYNVDEVKTESKVLMGIFRSRESDQDEGKYLLIINKDVTKNANINISLTDVFSISEINKVTGEEKYIKQGDNIIIDILPGEGKLFYVE